MIEDKQLHIEGDGIITNLCKRTNQIIGQDYKTNDQKIRAGIQTTKKTVEELKEQYKNDNKAPIIQEAEVRESLLDILG